MYEDRTPEAIRTEILDRMENVLDKREGSYTSDVVAAVALELSKAYQAQNAVIPVAFVDETSGEYIDKRCAEYGITRKPGTKAKATITFLGVDGTVIPQGTSIMSDTKLEYITLEEAAISDGDAKTTAEAAETGERYNLPAGKITQMSVSIGGISGVESSAAEGGTDPETDEALMGRLNDYRRNPSSGGNKYDYKRWAEEVNGVGRANIIPLIDGPGSVGVILVGPDMLPVEKETEEECKAHIEENRPIGAEVTVKSAEALEVNIDATLILEGTREITEIKQEFTESLTEYLESLTFKSGAKIIYNKVLNRMLSIDGVEDCTDMTVNNAKASIEITEQQVPTLGTVEVTEE